MDEYFLDEGQYQLKNNCLKQLNHSSLNLRIKMLETSLAIKALTFMITHQGMSFYMFSSSKQLPTNVTAKRSHSSMNEQVSF